MLVAVNYNLINLSAQWSYILLQRVVYDLI